MNIADTETYRPILEAELRRNTKHAFELLIVPDIAEWASIRTGNIRGNPPATSVIDGETGVWGILIRRSYDSNKVASILGRINHGGFTKANETLNTSELFLRHLVLHELAHLENDWQQDEENNCDAWAFEKLEIAVI